MSKLVLFFLLFFITLVNSGFLRPWENQTWISTNPSIYSDGVEIWWNIPELDKSLNSIYLDHLPANTSVDSYISNAQTYLTLAKNNSNSCTHAVVLAPLFISSHVIHAERVFYAATITSIDDCMRYKTNWRLTFDYSLKAIEKSETTAIESIQESQEIYEEIYFTGICNQNFSHRNDNYCDRASAAFTTIDSGLTEGEFGGYNIFLKSVGNLKTQLNHPTPDFSEAEVLLNLVWGRNGIVPTFSNLSQTGINFKNSTEKSFDLLLVQTEGKKVSLEAELSSLEKQKLHLIHLAPSSFVAQKSGTISYLFSDLKQQKSLADIDLQTYSLMRKNIFRANYLSLSMMGVSNINQDYSSLIIESTILFENAKQTVVQQRTNALDQINTVNSMKNPSPETLELLDEAKQIFGKGEQSKALGDQFICYSEALILARTAASQRNYENELTIKTSLKELKLLIENAKKDEINVVVEEENFALLTNLENYQIDMHVQSAIKTIISKAQIKYEQDLLGTRSEILDKLSSAGDSAADLYTDLEIYEQDIVLANRIMYPGSIGRLKELRENYLYLNSELDQYLGDVVGNSMSVKATPIFSEVLLDQPVDIFLDLVLTNPKPYAAKNVQVPILFDSPISFLYSDIESGQDSVESLFFEGDALILVFDSVDAFDSKHVTFKKKSILAHTRSEDLVATGIGNDAAYVVGTLNFELDTSISHLDLPQDPSNITIDGATPDRELQAGHHKLTYEKIVHNAYSESKKNIKAYSLGINSQIEYDIEIIPTMNLDSVPVLINSINNSQASSLRVFAATGESIVGLKRLSETQSSATVKNLKKSNPTILKVSYIVEDTESYVKAQLTTLTQLNSSSSSQKILDQAKFQAANSNYTKALELIDQFKTSLISEEKTTAKLQKKFIELQFDFLDELDEINYVIPNAPTNSSFVNKLIARQDELERVSEDLSNSNLSQKVFLLEKMDFKWKSKEITNLKKSSYAEYNDLKERFFEAGNSTTPVHFLEFENALTKLEVGSRLEYAIEVVSRLDAVRTTVIAQENMTTFEKNIRKEKFEKLKLDSEIVLDQYLKQASAAKGTEFSGMFTESERKVTSLIKEVESALDSDLRVFSIKLSTLNTSKSHMHDTLSSLESQSSAKTSLILSLLQQSDLTDQKRSTVLEKLRSMEQMHESGDYVNALRAGSLIAKELSSTEESDGSPLLILGITALAVLAVIGAYMAKQKKPKKEFKKVPKITEF